MFSRPTPAMAVSILSLFIALGSAGFAANGGMFILGANNAATLRTYLASNVAGKGLLVANYNTAAGATALGLAVSSGKPPLAVNSAVKVVNLNADKLDGFSANQLGRVAYKEAVVSSWLEDGRATLLSVTLSAPQSGFVTLAGGAGAFYPGGCAYCAVHLRFRIDSSADTASLGTVITKDGAEQHAPLSHIVTVPVTQGTHVYELIGSWYDVNQTNITPSWFDQTLSAHFIPFNGEGTTSIPAAAQRNRTPLAATSRVMQARH